MPDEKSRESILEKLCSKYTISADFSLKTLARLTPGFVGGDLHELTNDALSTACRRVREYVCLELLIAECAFPKHMTSLNFH